MEEVESDDDIESMQPLLANYNIYTQLIPLSQQIYWDSVDRASIKVAARRYKALKTLNLKALPLGTDKLK